MLELFFIIWSSSFLIFNIENPDIKFRVILIIVHSACILLWTFKLVVKYIKKGDDK